MLTLALGIGAATAVFSVVNTVLLEPLPYRDSDRLVRIVERAAPANPSAPLLRRTDMTWSEMTEWRKASGTLADLALSITPPITLMPTSAGSARLTGALVSANTFAMLGARARLGRTLDAADGAPGRRWSSSAREPGSGTSRATPAFSDAPSRSRRSDRKRDSLMGRR